MYPAPPVTRIVALSAVPLICHFPAQAIGRKGDTPGRLNALGVNSLSRDNCTRSKPADWIQGLLPSQCRITVTTVFYRRSSPQQTVPIKFMKAHQRFTTEARFHVRFNALRMLKADAVP